MTATLRPATPLVAAGVLLAVGFGARALVTGSDGPGGGGDGASRLRPAPEFSLDDLRGGPVKISLAGAAGGRPAVLNFFASWCEPCKRELPALEAAHRGAGGRVAFIGVDHQDSRDSAVAMLDEAGATYPAGYDPRGSVATAYGLRGLPATVFVTADGRILETVRGELSRAEIDERIERLLTAVPALRRQGS